MPVRFDSKAFEDDFFKAAIDAVQVVMEQESNEPYYGFALYADSYYTDCGFYFATESSYRESLARADPEYIRTKESRWNYRWNCGDWACSSFGAAPQALADIAKETLRKWSRNAEDQFDADGLTDEDWEEYGRGVLEATCRVGARLEADATFQMLPKTDDFHIVISDHDEIVVASYLRPGVFKTRGIVLLPNSRTEQGVDYHTELTHLLASWHEDSHG